MHLNNQLERLQSILTGYGRLAVAFSGGVDSSLLLKCCLDTLGAGNVLVLFGKSELLPEDDLARAENWLASNGFPQGVEMEIVDLQPLSWKEFVQNPENRCYLCKLRIYKIFKEIMEKRGFSKLADGTNTDDLKDRRPGLRAIHQLGVVTPLVEAGFDKATVRACSKELGLSSWNLASASCLATRIPTGLEITTERLQTIAQWEKALASFGFEGCRVRMSQNNEQQVFVQLAGEDIAKLGSLDMRVAILRYFRNLGVKKVFFDLEGR